MKSLKNLKYSFLLLSLITINKNIYSQLCSDNGVKVVLNADGVCNYDYYALVFEDNFNGTSLDMSNWKLPYQGVDLGTNLSVANMWYANTGNTPSIPMANNIEVSNGTLKLIARKESTPINGKWVSDFSTTPWTYQTASFSYSSAEILTKNTFGYGKYEMRCKLPKGKGFWPAFWTFGTTGWNEIDIFEFWNEYKVDLLLNKVYDPSKLSRIPNLCTHHTYGEEINLSCPSKSDESDFSESFHVFTMIWDNYKIEWYIDGNLKRRSTKFYTILGQQLDCGSIQGYQPYLKDKAYPMEEFQTIIMDLAISAGADSPDATTPFPSALEIDYVRYYKQVSCSSVFEATDNSQLNIVDGNFNVIAGTTVILESNINIAYNQQLELTARDAIWINPGFTTNLGSNFLAQIDPAICAGKSASFAETTPDVIALDSLNKNNSLSTEENFGVKVYPNPTKDILIVETQTILENYQVNLIDLHGSILYNSKKTTTNREEIDVKNLAAGTYTLQIINTQTKTVYVNKIIKE